MSSTHQLQKCPVLAILQIDRYRLPVPFPHRKIVTSAFLLASFNSVQQKRMKRADWRRE